jgi:hypothetical protein
MKEIEIVKINTNDFRKVKSATHFTKEGLHILFKNGIAYQVMIDKMPDNTFRANLTTIRRAKPKEVSLGIDHNKLLEFYRQRLLHSSIAICADLAKNKIDATSEVRRMHLTQSTKDPRSVKHMVFKAGPIILVKDKLTIDGKIVTCKQETAEKLMLLSTTINSKKKEHKLYKNKKLVFTTWGNGLSLNYYPMAS